MSIFVEPLPFQEALDKLGRKTVITAPLTSAEWSEVPTALRERAFFSSRVENGRFLQRGQDLINDFLASSRETLPDGQTALKLGGRARFVEQMREFAIKEGMADLVPPEDRGGLKDITSQKRLELIFNTQVKQADDFGYRKQGMDPDVLDAYPAQRFIRVVDVQEPRSWHAQFEDKVFLKTSPIWKAINQDFGVPWGPWGWGCGHDVEDVDRDETESLGLLKPGEAVAPPPPEDFNDNLKASTDGIEPELIQKWKAAFKDQIVIEDDGTMRWRALGSQATTVEEPKAPERKNPVSAALDLKVRGDLRTHVKSAIEAMDSVHDDGNLPKIPVKGSRKNSNGYFRRKVGADGKSTADHIGVRASGNWPALTTAHEAGHFLDLEGIGAKGTYASASGELKEVLDAAKQSQAVVGLQSKMASTTSWDIRDHIQNYLLTDKEIWARAYSQYIAERSHSNPLKAQLQARLAATEFEQWTTEDFAPVAKAIDKLFTKLGWI